MTLTNDGKFQTEKVALLDFENGEDGCTNGTKEFISAVHAALL